MKIDLTVIILSYNTKKLLEECLGSIQKAAKNKYRYQIIVVDNASTDGSPEMVVKKFPKVKLIRSSKNLGFSKGNNLALSSSKGRYLLFLNSDTQVKPEAFKKTISFMDERPQAGALTCKTMLASGGLDLDCHRGFPQPWASITYFLGLEKLFPQSRLFGQYHKFYLNLNQAHEIDAGSGAFMMIRHQLVKKIGGWDEKYFFYGEDLDFYYRIKQAGWQVMFYPEALVTHHKGASSGLRQESKAITQATRATRLQTARASIQAMEIFYKKFYQDKYPRWLTQLVLLAIKLKGLLRLVHQLLKP